MAYRLEVAFAQFAGPCEYHLETLKSSSFIGELLFFFFNSPLHSEWGIQSCGFDFLAAVEIENASKHHIGNLTVQ